MKILSKDHFIEIYKSIPFANANMVKSRVKCVDGYTISIQNHIFSYSSNNSNPVNPDPGSLLHDDFELGFPNMEDDLIKSYAEDSDNLTETVYAYVQIGVVIQLINKHGGILLP